MDRLSEYRALAARAVRTVRTERDERTERGEDTFSIYDNFEEEMKNIKAQVSILDQILKRHIHVPGAQL